jgi:hypothetical protein
VIKPCDGARCDNAYQDAQYGTNVRVHNEMANGGRRCTVCEKEVASSGKTSGKK